MTDAPERIWVWKNKPHGETVISAPDEPYPTGSPEYIRLDPHEAAVAAARAEGMRTVLERIESAAQILRKAKLNDHAGAIEAAIADARDEFPEAAE